MIKEDRIKLRGKKETDSKPGNGGGGGEVRIKEPSGTFGEDGIKGGRKAVEDARHSKKWSFVIIQFQYPTRWSI